MKRIKIYLLITAVWIAGWSIVKECAKTNAAPTMECITLTNTNTLDYEIYNDITIHPGITIDSDTGSVTIPTNMTMTEAATTFWNAVTGLYGTKDCVLDNLAQSGDICERFAHRWSDVKHGVVPDRNGGWCIMPNAETRECLVCGRYEVKVLVTEVIERRK